MSEDLGSTTRPLSLKGEQWVLETRTDDPVSPAPDERWIRTDLTSGDREATLKCGDGTEIPLFPTGLAEDTVREALRFRVGGQTLFAPIVPVSDAAYPSRRIQHDGQLHGYHNRVAPGYAIPDSVIDHYESSLYEDQGLTLSDYYSGDLSLFERQQTTVLEGDYTLRADTDGGIYNIYDNGNLNNYIRQGKRARFKAQLADQENNGYLLFGGTDVNNTYGVRLGSAGGEFTLAKIISGSITNLVNASYTYSTGVTYEVEIGWSTANEFDVTLLQGGSEEVSLPVVSDSEFNSDGLGYRVNSPTSSTVYYDDIREVGDY